MRARTPGGMRRASAVKELHPVNPHGLRHIRFLRRSRRRGKQGIRKASGLALTEEEADNLLWKRRGCPVRVNLRGWHTILKSTGREMRR